MADDMDSSERDNDKDPMAWFDDPEIEKAWVLSVTAADRAALDAGAFRADLILAHLRCIADLRGLPWERFADRLSDADIGDLFAGYPAPSIKMDGAESFDAICASKGPDWSDTSRD